MLRVTKTSQFKKKSFFFLHFFPGNVFHVLRDCQKFKFSNRKMILSPPETCFLKCLYWKLSDTQMDNDCSNLLNKLLLSIIFHVITQNCLRDSIRGILKIDIHVSYSSPMPESAIIIVIRKIDLKTNSPVSELSSDIFGWSNLACYPVSQDKTLFFISIFFALRNDNQNGSHSHHRYGNGKGRFKTKCIWDFIEIRLTLAEIFNPKCQEKNVRLFFGWVYKTTLMRNE